MVTAFPADREGATIYIVETGRRAFIVWKTPHGWRGLNKNAGGAITTIGKAIDNYLRLLPVTIEARQAKTNNTY